MSRSDTRVERINRIRTCGRNGRAHVLAAGTDRRARRNVERGPADRARGEARVSSSTWAAPRRARSRCGGPCGGRRSGQCSALCGRGNRLGALHIHGGLPWEVEADRCHAAMVQGPRAAFVSPCRLPCCICNRCPLSPEQVRRRGDALERMWLCHLARPPPGAVTLIVRCGASTRQLRLACHPTSRRRCAGRRGPAVHLEAVSPSACSSSASTRARSARCSGLASTRVTPASSARCASCAPP